MQRRENRSLWRKGLIFIMTMAIAVASLPFSVMATENVPAAMNTGSGGAVHDYGKSGDDPATDEDESAIVANSDVFKSAQYQESTKYSLTANGTPVSVYKYQKQTDPGKFYHMDVARFSSDDAAPTFQVTLKDGTTIDSVTVYPERYYPQEAFQISEDKKTLTFQMSEGLRYCIVNINGTENDTNGKPQLAIINDPTEVKPDLSGDNVLNFKTFSEQYLEEHPITDKVGETCTEGGTVTDTSMNNDTEYTWEYGKGVYQDYWDSQVKFPNKRARLSYDVSDAFQAALEEVRKSNTLDTIYFPAGTYVWSGLSIKNWDGNGKDGHLTIYTDENALMVNRMQECQEAMEPAIGIWNSSNITVSGRGIFDGQGTYSKLTDKCDADKSGHQGGCMLVHSQNITFNDTYVRDVKQWNWECHTVENVTYNNIKGLTPYQHSWVDGLDLTSGKNVTVNGAITMGNDDTFASGHYNPSDGFPYSKLKGKDLTNLSTEDQNVAAAAAIYNKDRLQWDNADSENFTINNTLGWSTFANAVRLGHNTKWKADGGSYQMKNYTFNNLNTLHVKGWNPNLGGGAVSIQNGTSGCHPNYQSLVFNNCSFTANAGNSARIPITNDFTDFYPDQVTLKNCWFKDADTPVEFRKIKNVLVEDLYVGGKLVEYTSQVNLKLGTGDQAVDHFTFLANGKPVKENKLPVFTAPEENIQAYANNPLVFYVKAEDKDQDEVTFGEVDLSAMEGASFDSQTGKFSWTPSEEAVGKTYEVVFTASDYTNQPVQHTVRIEVGSPANSAQGFTVAEDAHMQSWKTEKTQNFGKTRYLTIKLISGSGLMNEKFTNTSTGDGTDGKITYLKFNLSEMKKQKGLYDKAELVLTYINKRYNNNNGETDSVRVAAVDDSTWTADKITWNTKPAFTVDESSVKESNAFNLGSSSKDKPSANDEAINGARVKTDITEFVTDAINADKDYLTLAVCETKGIEVYFVSQEGAGKDGFGNATQDMAPSILLNLPVAVDIEGPSEMTIAEGYQAVETNSFALKGKGPFTVTLSCEKADGKITWNDTTQQIQVAPGLKEGTYKATLTVKNKDNEEKTAEFTLTVEGNPDVPSEREDIPQSEITATADSAQEAASNAVDGKTDTKWHTSWASGHSTVPLSITLDLGSIRENVTQLRYLPRQDKKADVYQWNGDILEYEISVSETGDADSFTKVAQGTWEDNKEEKSATFAPVAARYVKLTAIHTKGNNDNEYDQFASAAEINIAAGGVVNLEEKKANLSKALESAKTFLESTTKTDTELVNLKALVAEAEKLVTEDYLPTEEDLTETAEKLTAEVERLSKDTPVTNYTSFTPNSDWQDTSGTRIQAHGGCILWDEATQKYYWYGEHKGEDKFSAAIGVSCYSSTDLYNWKNEGVALPVFNNPAFLGEDYTDDTPLYLAESSKEYQQAKVDGKKVSQYDTLEKYNSASYIAELNKLYDGVSAADKKALYDKLNWNCVMERPKVIYNEKTKKYVMWFHKDGEGVGTYKLAQTGIAVSDSPAGPFKLVDSINPNGFESRDMTLFVDDNGKAYLLHSSEGNKTLYIAELNDEYTGLTGNYSRNYVENGGSMAVYAREAPALFKYAGKYYLISSGCTGWDPNQMGYSVTDNLTTGMSEKGGDGPFQMDNLQNPCIGTDADISYYGQSAYVFPVQGKDGCFIYTGDKWNKYNLKDSRYQWLPIQIDAENSALTIAWNKEWTLDAFNSLNTDARKAMNAAVKRGKALSEEEYGGTERWTTLQTLLIQAGDLDYAAEEATVNAMTASINEAIEGLETWNGLEAALKKVEALFDGDYTPESWTEVQTAYNSGKALGTDASKEDIQSAAQAIEAALAKLVKANVELENVDLANASVTADSQQSGNEAAKAVDGNKDTHWHSAWGDGFTELPHYITIDLGKPVENLYQLTYLPRQDKDANGIVTKYEILVSNGAADGSAPSDDDFVSVRTGTWEDNKEQKSASFRTEGAGRYVRFKVLEGHGGFASAAEIGLKTLKQSENPATVKELKLTLPTKQEYFVGEQFDPTGMKVIAVYDDAESTEKDVTNDVVIEGFDTTKASKKVTVTVSFGGKTESFDIVVKEQPTLSEIKITGNPTKTEYCLGEELDLKGLKVIAVYSDNSKQEVTESISTEGFDSAVPGEKTITVIYKEKTASFKVNVKDEVPADVTLEGLELTPPTKIQYVVGDKELDTAGMKVDAVYSSGVRRDVTSLAEISGFDSSAAGKVTVTVSYTEKEVTKTADFDVQISEAVVENPTLSKIEVSKLPDKTEYQKDEPEDMKGLEVTAYYEDGSRKVLENSDYTVTGFDSSKAGEVELTVTYTENEVTKTTTFEMTVKEVLPPEKELTGLRIAKNPDKTEYTVGETLDLTGLQVMAVYSDNSEVDVTADVEVTGFDSTQPGPRTITLKYNEKETVFMVTVKKAEQPEEGAIKELLVTAPKKTEYEVGEALDLTGMKVTAVYEDGTQKDVTNLVIVTGYDSSKAGDVTVTVSYKDVQTVFTVKVKEKTSNTKPSTPQGNNGNVEGGKKNPSANTTTGTSAAVSKNVKTGDSTNVMFPLIMLGAAGIVLAVFFVRKKKCNK